MIITIGGSLREFNYPYTGLIIYVANEHLTLISCQKDQCANHVKFYIRLAYRTGF